MALISFGSGSMGLGGSTSGQSIALELGLSGTAQISLNDSTVRTLLGKSSGAISFYDAYGKSNVTVVNFPVGTSTFTVPAGVTNLKTVTGQGEVGTTSASWTNYDAYMYLTSTYAAYPFNPSGTEISNTTTVADVYNEVVSNFNSFLAAVPDTNSTRYSTRTENLYFRNWPTTGSVKKQTLIYDGGYWRRELGVTPYIDGPSSSTTLVKDVTSNLTWVIRGMEIETTSTSGGRTTQGFSRTFSGTTNGSTPAITTYTNVAVNAGQTYTVRNYNQLSISY